MEGTSKNVSSSQTTMGTNKNSWPNDDSSETINIYNPWHVPWPCLFLGLLNHSDIVLKVKKEKRRRPLPLALSFRVVDWHSFPSPLHSIRSLLKSFPPLHHQIFLSLLLSSTPLTLLLPDDSFLCLLSDLTIYTCPLSPPGPSPFSSKLVYLLPPAPWL